jgi:TolB-like protein/tetratricopeptide (TPR) repeat protein
VSFFNELKRRNVIRVAIAYGVASWFVLQLSDVVLENISAPGWVMQTIMLVLVAGFPLVIIFAWAFEMTPEGIKKEKDVDRSQSIANQTGRKLDRMIIAVLVVVVGYLLVDKLILTDSAPEPQQSAQSASQEPAAITDSTPSVAVLPFVNMSGDKDNEYFSDGLTETLLHMLAQLPDLRVAARTSSFAFKGQNTDIGEIAKVLGVAHILEGSVQKSGERVRVTAQLIRASDGFHVWSQNYTRPLEDIFAIQDEIAADVANALDSTLLGGGKPEIHGVNTKNLVAYESYLKGLEQYAIHSYGSLTIAENHFKQALARDPEFIDARLSLIRTYLRQLGTGLIENQEAKTLLDPLLSTVREQQPDNRYGRALEIVSFLQTNNAPLGQAEVQPLLTELRNLLPLIPTETLARQQVASYLNFLFSDPQSALEVLEAGLMIDPLDVQLYMVQGSLFIEEDQLDKALISFQRAQELAPENPNIYSRLARIEEEKNNLAGGLEWRRQATEVDPQDHELAAEIAITLYLLDLPEEGDKWHARVMALAPSSPVAKSVELRRLLTRKEFQLALELSRSMVADQIEDRNGAFFTGIFNYTALMQNSGRAREAYDFLVSVRPEITNFDELPADFQGMMMQWNSVLLMAEFESTESRKEAWLALTTNLDKTGFPWREPDDTSYLTDKLITGDIEDGINAYLEHRLTQPMATFPKRHRITNRVFYAPVIADPRVVARTAQLEEEYQQLRGEIQELMLQPEWQQ